MAITDEIRQAVTGLVSEDLLQISYQDSADAVAQRFDRWLDRGLVRAFDAWMRGE